MAGLPAPWWADVPELAGLTGEWGPDALVLIDPDCRVRYASRSIERVLGFDRSFDLGGGMFDFVHPEDMVAATGALNAATRTNSYQHPVEFRVRHVEGHWVDCEVNGTSVDGPGGAWVILSIRATRDREPVMGRRRRLEQLIRMASLECSAVRGEEVDQLVDRFLSDLAEILGAESVELAWEETDDDLRVGARWPNLGTSATQGGEAERFDPLWPIEESAAMLLRVSTDLDELSPGPARDRFLRMGTRSVVELPLSARAPWGIVRLAFRDGWEHWKDANVDLVTVLVTTLMATLRRCVAEAHLQEQARTDPLTGLLNRVELYRRFESLLAHHGSGSRHDDGGEIGVLYGDLDLFKQVNDRWGHAAGDRLLIEVADTLRYTVRDVDLVARFGGDEFVVVCPHLESASSLERIAERVTRAIEQLADHGIPVRITLGGAIARPGLSADEVVRLADEAMYRHKHAGDL